jgi:hypothetical protein
VIFEGVHSGFSSMILSVIFLRVAGSIFGFSPRSTSFTLVALMPRNSATSGPEVICFLRAHRIHSRISSYVNTLGNGLPAVSDRPM